MKATVDDLTRQLDQLESKEKFLTGFDFEPSPLLGLLRAREEEAGSLRGEKAGLQREVDRLNRENRGLRDQVAALQDELAKQAAGMEQAE